MISLCTLFDHRYLDKGLSLHASLLQQGYPFNLWILCMDSDSYHALSRLKLENVTLVTVEDLERHDQDVSRARSNRSLVEFYFTIKSFLCLYILDSHPYVDLITYLDADLYFFGSPAVIIEEMTGYSIGITPHRFPVHLKQSEQYGLFNAGFISIRRDETGTSCLRWWRNSCFTWCHDYVSEGRFADQRYLDNILDIFPNVKSIRNKGINAAPWNISQYRCSRKGDIIKIDDDVLTLYHFHGIRKLYPFLYDSGLASHHNVLHKTVRQFIYMPYLRVLYGHQVPEFKQKSDGSIRVTAGRLDVLKRFLPRLWRSIYHIKDILTGFYYRSLIFYFKA